MTRLRVRSQSVRALAGDRVAVLKGERQPMSPGADCLRLLEEVASSRASLAGDDLLWRP